MDALDKRLLNEFQRDLPLTSRPFAEVGRQLELDEATVIRRLRTLQDQGVVSRVGPVFAPRRVGESLLAAMAVPPDDLDEVAALVSDYAEVNHNYEREHRYNLWFVVTAPDQAHLDGVLAEISARSGLEVLPLPLITDYHIDLGFRLDL